MPDVSTPSLLQEFAINLNERGGTGILVSGGSTLQGRVPLDRYISTLRWIKDNTDLILNIHPGLVDSAMADAIASTGVDMASVDLVGSTETVRRVYHLNAKADDYRDSLHFLNDAGVHVIPHITVGLDYGEIKGADQALQTAVDLEPEVIVVNALIPTAGTSMANVIPPPPETIIGYLQKAVKTGSQVSLGCMRPRHGKPELERAAVINGVHRVALPSNSTVKWAEGQGYVIKKLDGCCAIPVRLESRALRPS